MSEKEDEILANITDVLKKDLNPQQIILFGSRTKKKFCKNSDFDIAIDEKKPNIRTQRQLEEMIEEISGLYKVDIVYLKSVASPFREMVMKTGRIIYERKP